MNVKLSDVLFFRYFKLNFQQNIFDVVDMKKNELVAREARKKGITVIGLCGTNVNPALADYVIPGNDGSISSIGYILEKVKEVILKSKKQTK